MTAGESKRFVVTTAHIPELPRINIDSNIKELVICRQRQAP